MQPFPPPAPGDRPVVVYRPVPAFVTVLLWVFGLVACALFAFAGVSGLRTTHLRCDRASETCSIDSRLGPTSSEKTVPQASIRSTRLETVHGKKNSASYQVALVTASGTVEISGVSSGYAERTAQKSQIDRYLADKSQSSLDVTYDVGNATSLVAVPLSLIWLVVPWLLSRYARVEVDRSAGTLTLVMVRSPLPSVRRRLELGRVRDAIVTSKRSSKGGQLYAVGLVVDGEEAPVPLLRVWSSGRRAKDRAAAEIRALLQPR
jgi:hypothetical protein